MIIFKTTAALQHHLNRLKTAGKTIGFVPTMGALHPGHLSLILQAQIVCDVVATSIFVNPTQFNDPADFAKYPVTLDADCLLLERQQTAILFLPSVSEIYPEGEIYQYIDLGNLENIWEGKYRPGHFQGVCQVVNRLLKIVQPHQLFLGQKDYQQCKVIQRLIEITGQPTTINIIPTMREKDGLAMSSRNVRLSAEQRASATTIYQQLLWINENIAVQLFDNLITQATNALLSGGFTKVDYVAIVDNNTLAPVTAPSVNQKLVILIAAFMGDVRLIDNMLMDWRLELAPASVLS